MYKRALAAEIARARGSHALPLVRSRIEDMEEAEARQWLTLIRNIKDDAEQDGRRRPHPSALWRR